jgi:hypothetical protein
MARRSPFEQFDTAVEAILSQSGGKLPRAGTDLETAGASRC